MDINEFQRDKEIDPGRLDVECVKQADLFFKWAQAAVDASFDVDRAKLHLDVVKAKLDLECRKDPASFGLAKSTESAVDAAVKTHDDYKEAYEEFIEARKNSKLLDAAVTTMEQKKRMLEVLITLHGQQYFAGPSVPRDLVADWKEHQERVGSDVNDQQRSRTRKRGEKR